VSTKKIAAIEVEQQRLIGEYLDAHREAPTPAPELPLKWLVAHRPRQPRR
jgi:hypothetical protein